MISIPAQTSHENVNINEKCCLQQTQQEAGAVEQADEGKGASSGF